jgi:hypothetical protein
VDVVNSSNLMQTTSLKQLTQEDPKIKALTGLGRFQSKHDPTHLERRQQQRAISGEMILVALAYGKRERYCHAAVAFTVTDRSLQGTAFRKFIQQLRGLTVVCTPSPNGFDLHTVYWNFKVKAKSVKSKPARPARNLHWSAIQAEMACV